MANSNSPLLKSFYSQFVLLFASVSLLILSIQLWDAAFLSKYIWVLQGFFLFVGIGNHLISEKGLKNASDMHLYYLGSMSIRFLLSLIFLFIFIYRMKEGHFDFVLNFFILYLVYTSFEIYFLLRNLRPDFKTNGTVDKKI